MCKSKGALVILALFFCCWISVASTEDGSDKTLELLKNVTINNDFDSFQKILQSIDLKNVFANPAVQEGFKKFNIDVSVLANVKTKDYLKIFNLKNVFDEMKTIEAAGGNITYQAILNSLYKNVNTIQLISSVDWAKFLQVSSDGIQLPGMFAKLSLECALDLVKYFQPLVSANFSNPSTIGTIMQTPAVKMIDAMTKLPSGILGGNFYWLGSYDECQSIKGDVRYCGVGVKILTRDGALGTCMPKKCSGQDVASLYGLLLSNLLPQEIPKELFSFQYAALCEEDIEYSTGFIITIAICTIIMVLLLLGTFVDLVLGDSSDTDSASPKKSKQIHLADYKQEVTENGVSITSADGNELKKEETKYGSIEEKHDIMSPEKPKTPAVLRVLLCFSIIRNIKTVLSTDVPKGAIECINGIRALSMFWVILGHMYIFGLSSPNDNVGFFATKLIQRFTAQAIANAFVSVDSFFLLSGLLVGYLTLKRMDKSNGKINLVMYYLHRFIRLTPPYMFVILIWNNVFPYMIRGPSAQVTRMRGDGGMCNKYWWTNLLYISNFYPTTMGEECLGWSWYLSNDMQFYIVAPLILYLMFILERKFKHTSFRHVGPLFVALIGCFISIMIRMIIFGVNDYPALIGKGIMMGGSSTSDRQDALYIKPYTRISPYLVGLFLGYMLSRNLQYVSRKGTGVKFLGWLIAVLLGYAAVYGPYASAYKTLTDNFNKTENVLFGGFSAFVWSIAVAWVIYACHYGFGGLINDFLSWRAWIPLSRLTFGAYLLHPLVIFFFFTVSEKPHHFQNNLMVFDIISNTVLAYVAAFILAVGVEYPVLNLEKLAFKQ